jgi:manganese/iron transport system substrate-binding protein
MIRLPLTRGLIALAALALVAACTAAPATPKPTQPAATATPGAPTAPPSPAVAPIQTPSAEPLVVVASTTVLADLVRQIGGERVSVHSIIPAGRDVHTFDPAPSDAVLLASADLLVMNGVGLDEWFEDLAQDAAPGVALVMVGENLEGVEYPEGHDHDNDEHGDDDNDEHGDDDNGEHGDDDNDHALNPHLWLDVSNARRYVERITTTLVNLDPDQRAIYEADAAAYDARLAELDDWIRGEVGRVPAENRRVVSFHDAFPYFAHAYDIEIVGVIIESPGQEPAAGEIARLITAIREADVRAILTEIQFSDRLAQAIADETGVTVIDDLYTDSLGDPPLDTYEAAMRWNVERIVEGLR